MRSRLKFPRLTDLSHPQLTLLRLRKSQQMMGISSNSSSHDSFFHNIVERHSSLGKSSTETFNKSVVSLPLSADKQSRSSSRSFPSIDLSTRENSDVANDWALSSYCQAVGVDTGVLSLSRASSNHSTASNNSMSSEKIESIENLRRPCYDIIDTDNTTTMTVSIDQERPPSPTLNTMRSAFHTTTTGDDTVSKILTIMAKNTNNSVQVSSPSEKRPKVRRHAEEPAQKVYVDQTTRCDVLFGRGTGPRLHAGNQQHYKQVGQMRDEYRYGNEIDKKRVSRHLFQSVKEAGGWFLKKDKDGRWFEVPDVGALHKICQALREHKYPEERRLARRKVSRS